MKTRAFFLGLIFFISPSLFAQTYSFTKEDSRFLDLVERRAFNYFLQEHYPETGLVKDKASNFGPDGTAVASIAATGFGLSAMVVGVERGWVSREAARKYCTKTLRFFLDQMETNHGFFYHFVHWETGKRTHGSELSSIDTALLLAGALTAGEYFKGTEVETLANQIYERVDFQWMLNGGKTLSMGWDPRLQRFLPLRWKDYNESLILYLLAVGSPTHPIPADSWQSVNKRIGVYGPHVLIYSPPLFTHQYSHIWVDLRMKNDGFADYFENSRIATLVNRQFCLDHRRQYKTYSENVWGLTASLGPSGYRAYGAGPGGVVHDGTVAPTAAGSSIVFTPELSLNALKFMYENYKDRIWGKYGFVDAFNLDRKWYATDVLGIDQGPLVLMIENARSELIWRFFMRHPAVEQGLERMGFRSGTRPLRIPPRPILRLSEEAAEIHLESPQNRELGDISGPQDLKADFSLRADSNFMFLTARVSDDSLVAKMKNNQIWRDDLVELYIDPQGNGFRWGSPRDIQLGFGPPGPDGAVKSWIWPRNFDPVKQGDIEMTAQRRPGGYDIKARIPWKFLGITPRPNLSFGLTLAVHDVDQDGSEGKLVWYFLPEGRSDSTILGEVILASGR